MQPSLLIHFHGKEKRVRNTIFREKLFKLGISKLLHLKLSYLIKSVSNLLIKAVLGKNEIQ